MRREAIKAVTDYAIPDKDFSEPLGDLFAKNVFGPTEMKARLPKSVFKSVIATIEKGAPLDPAWPTPSPRRCATGRWRTAPRTTPTSSTR